MRSAYCSSEGVDFQTYWNKVKGSWRTEQNSETLWTRFDLYIIHESNQQNIGKNLWSGPHWKVDEKNKRFGKALQTKVSWIDKKQHTKNF